MVTLADGTRKRVRQPDATPLSFSSKSEARKKAAFFAEQAKTLRRRQDAKPPRPALSDEGEQWWADYFEERRRRGDSDWKGEFGKYRKHIRPVVPADMAKVTREDCEHLRDVLDRKIRSDEMAWKTAWNVWSVWTTACASLVT